MSANLHGFFFDDVEGSDPKRKLGVETEATLRPVRVVCIGATGQSGSTLLSRMLGTLPAFVAVGEVGRIWDKGLIENVRCGCGEGFITCAFWTRVGIEAFGGWGEVDPREATRLRGATTMQQRRAPHAAALPFIRHPNLWPAFGRDLADYAALMDRVYRALDRVTGGQVLVDSMKLPGHVYLASTMPGIDVSVVHLTRDPRGYAYSNTKWVERQGAREGAFRARRTPRKSAIKWTWANMAFEHLARAGTPTVGVRYEDVVAHPRATMRDVAGALGAHVTDDTLSFIREGAVDLPPQHLVAGSRSRFASGRTALRPDDEWMRRLSTADRGTIEAITWPVRRRYGYLGALAS